MAKTDYDIESRLQLFVLMESVEAAARKNDPSLASQAHEKMALWMPTAPLSHDHRQKLLDITIRQVLECTQKWARGDRNVTAEMVENAAKRAIPLLNK
jgi:hypothetical protein